jgi:hypothetical protein
MAPFCTAPKAGGVGEFRTALYRSSTNSMAGGSWSALSTLISMNIISDEFEGCDFNKIYRLDNGLLFECATFSYSYAYRPEVKIFLIEGRNPTVFIDGEEYDGILFRTN